MIRVRALTALTALALLFLVPGCWSRREIEDLAFVTMAGVDIGRDPSEVILTVHIARPSAIAGTGGMAQERQVSVVSSTGSTIGEASDNLAEVLPRRITWAHSTVVAAGEEYAREGISGLLDFLARVESTRETVILMIVREGTAFDLMQVEHGLDQLPSAAVLGMVQNASHVTSTSVLTTVNDALKLLETPGTEMTMPGMRVKPLESASGQPPNTAGQLQRSTLSSSAEVAGVAVFRGDRLAGWLDQEQARGLQWLRGEVTSAIVPVSHPTDPGTTVSLKVKSSRSSVGTAMVDGNPEVRIVAEVVAIIGDSEETPTPSYWGVASDLERALESAIQAEITATIDQGVRKLPSDIFGFGTTLYRANPQQWNQLESQWGELLEQIQVEIEVQANMPQTGFLVRGS